MIIATINGHPIISMLNNEFVVKGQDGKFYFLPSTTPKVKDVATPMLKRQLILDIIEYFQDPIIAYEKLKQRQLIIL